MLISWDEKEFLAWLRAEKLESQVCVSYSEHELFRFVLYSCGNLHGRGNDVNSIYYFLCTEPWLGATCTVLWHVHE